jgi:hypothetical protein
MQVVSLLFGALIRVTEEAAASISSSAANNLSAARFFNRALLDLSNRRVAELGAKTRE